MLVYGVTVQNKTLEDEFLAITGSESVMFKLIQNEFLKLHAKKGMYILIGVIAALEILGTLAMLKWEKVMSLRGIFRLCKLRDWLNCFIYNDFWDYTCCPYSY